MGGVVDDATPLSAVTSQMSKAPEEPLLCGSQISRSLELWGTGKIEPVMCAPWQGVHGSDPHLGAWSLDHRTWNGIPVRLPPRSSATINDEPRDKTLADKTEYRANMAIFRRRRPLPRGRQHETLSCPGLRIQWHNCCCMAAAVCRCRLDAEPFLHLEVTNNSVYPIKPMTGNRSGRVLISRCSMFLASWQRRSTARPTLTLAANDEP